ncbi:hypothetical protein B0H19DRAFT_1077377 [Mycena capillaripes]|nr:hypothetical protein B0H19DRAFT_1077377 [Mycena capillaripes]
MSCAASDFGDRHLCLPTHDASVRTLGVENRASRIVLKGGRCLTSPPQAATWDNAGVVGAASPRAMVLLPPLSVLGQDALRAIPAGADLAMEEKGMMIRTWREDRTGVWACEYPSTRHARSTMSDGGSVGRLLRSKSAANTQSSMYKRLARDSYILGGERWQRRWRSRCRVWLPAEERVVDVDMGPMASWVRDWLSVWGMRHAPLDSFLTCFGKDSGCTRMGSAACEHGDSDYRTWTEKREVVAAGSALRFSCSLYGAFPLRCPARMSSASALKRRRVRLQNTSFCALGTWLRMRGEEVHAWVSRGSRWDELGALDTAGARLAGYGIGGKLYEGTSVV